MTWELQKVIIDPAWPWSVPTVGLLALVGVATLLAVLTVWTYKGLPQAGSRRVTAVLALRLVALVLAILTVLRPALSFSEEKNFPSVLLLGLDQSESMTVQDEIDSQSRWDALRRAINRCQPILNRLRDEHNVTVHVFSFAEDIRDFDPQGKADGKRSDYGQALLSLYHRFGQEKYLRGLLLLGDGADNGTRYPALTEALKWRTMKCPLHTFALGQTTTTSKQRDMGWTGINAEPAPVPVKGKLTVKGTLDAPGFENAPVRVRLFIDDKEVAVQEETIGKSNGNEVKVVTDAPIVPGEVKVTLKVEPLPGEVSVANNEIGTYVTVAKEGVSVLFVEGKIRAWEPKFIRYALSQDPRIRLFEALRLTDQPPPPEEADLFQLDKQHYDVIILGDISARRLSAGNPQILEKIAEQVTKKGTGLLMMGGYETFGNSDWATTGAPIADVLPVAVDVIGQVEGEVPVRPTLEGLRHYVLRLADKEADSAALWEKLPALEGMTRLGEPKPNAVVLARAGDPKTGPPVLVGLPAVGAGRALAFAGDTTWRWRRLGAPKSLEGVQVHARFWKQLILWLARQDETDGSVWVKPDTRRLAAASRLGFTVGLRGKGGVDLTEARFEVTVINPDKAESTVAVAREQTDERGTFWKTDLPGEYRLVVRGRGKDIDGQEVSGETTARFLVYQDDTEMARQAADHDFLEKLAREGGGNFYRVEELSRVLQDVPSKSPFQGRAKTQFWPDWRKAPPGFLTTFFLLFVAVLCLEWLLRRYWGMV